MDLYRIFKPAIYISRVFCLAPFAAFEDCGSTRYKFSTFWLLYSILGVCVSFIFQINTLRISLFLGRTNVINVAYNVMAAAACVASVVTQVLCLNNGKNVLRILDHVSALDSEHSGARISYYRLYRVFIVLLIYSIISLVAPNIIIFAALNTNSLHNLRVLYYTTVHFIFDAVMLLSDTQFIHFVLLLKYRFSALNDTVINFPVQSLYKTSLNHMIRATAVDRSVHSNTSAVSSSVTVLKSTVRKVCRHHDSLCDISEFVNRTYSFQILLSVTLACLEVIFTTHSVTSEFSDFVILQYFSSTEFLSKSTVFWIFAMTAKVVLLVAVCNLATHEVSGLHLWCPHVWFLNTWLTEKHTVTELV